MKRADPDGVRRSAQSSDAVRVVAFRLASRCYALPLDVVSEILPMVAIRSVPDTPSSFAGVIDLRGRIVSIVDPKAPLGLPDRPFELDDRIVVVRRDGRLFGFVADEVIGVVTLPESELRRADEEAPASPLLGFARHGDELVFVLRPEWLVERSNEVYVERVG